MSDDGAKTIAGGLLVLGFFIFMAGLVSKPPRHNLYGLAASADRIANGMQAAACINSGHKWEYGYCEYAKTVGD